MRVYAALLAVFLLPLAGCPTPGNCPDPPVSSPIPPGTYSSIVECDIIANGVVIESYAAIIPLTIGPDGYQTDDNGCPPILGQSFVSSEDGQVIQAVVDNITVAPTGYTWSATITSYGTTQGTGMIWDIVQLLGDGTIDYEGGISWDEGLGEVQFVCRGTYD